MGLGETLARGRLAAEARMTSRVTVHRASDRAAQDEATGRERLAWVTVASNIPFRLDGPSDGATRTVEVAGVQYQQATATGHLPVSSVDLVDHDLLEVTVGEWSGTVWRVVEASRADQKTARRVPIAQESRPEEWE